MVTLLSISYFSLSVLALTFAPDHILSFSPIPVPRPLIRTLRKFLCPTASYIGSLVLRHLSQRFVDVATDSRSWYSCSTLLARSATLWIARLRSEGLEGAQDTDDNSLSASSRINCTPDYIAGGPRGPTADPSETDADLILLPGGWPAVSPDELQAESADIPTGLQLCLDRDCVRGYLYSDASEEACAITSADAGRDVPAAPGGVVLTPAQLVSAYVYGYYPVQFLLVTARVRTRPHSVQVLLYSEDTILVLLADSSYSDIAERTRTRGARSVQPLSVVLDLLVRSRARQRPDGVGPEVDHSSDPHNDEYLSDRMGAEEGEQHDCRTPSATDLEPASPPSAGTPALLHASSRAVHLLSDPGEEIIAIPADGADCHQDVNPAAALRESRSSPPTLHQLEDANDLPSLDFLHIATADDSGTELGATSTERRTCLAADGVGDLRSQQGDHHICEQRAYSDPDEENTRSELYPASNVEATSSIRAADAAGCERDVDIATSLRELEAESTPPTFRQTVQVDDLPPVHVLRIADADQLVNTPRSTDTKTREAADSLGGLHADHRQQGHDHVWEQTDSEDQGDDLTLNCDAISTTDDQNVNPDTTLGASESTPVTTQDGLNGIGVLPSSEEVQVAANSDSDAFDDPPGPLHRDSNPDHSDGDADVIPVVTTDLPPIEPLNALGQGATTLASAAPPELEPADSDLRPSPSPQLNFPLSRKSTVNSLRATMVSTVVWKEPHSPVSPDFASCSSSSRSDDNSRLEQAEDDTTARAPEADREHDADADWQSNSPKSPSKRYPYIMRAVSQPRRRRLAMAVTERDVDIRARPRTYSYEPPPTPTRGFRAPTPPLLSLMPHLKDGSDLSVDTFETCVTSRFSGSSTPSTSTSASRSVSLRQESSHATSTLDLSSDLFGEFDLPELPAPSSASVGGAIHEVPSLDLPSELFEPFALPELSFSSCPSSSSASSSAFLSGTSILASADPVGSPETERKVPTDLPRVVFPSSGSDAAGESLDEPSSDHFHTFQSSYAESVRSTSRYTDSLAQFGTRVGKEKEKWWRSLSLKTRPISVSVSDSASAHSKTSTKLKLKRLVSLSAVRGPLRRSSLKEKRATWDGRGEPVQEDPEMGFLGHSGSTTTGLGSGPLAVEGLGRRGKRKTALSLRSTASASTCASTPSVASGDSGSVRGLDVRMLPRYA